MIGVRYFGTSRMQEPKPHAPGERYGLVTIIREAPSVYGARYLVRCDCGVERFMKGSELRRHPPRTHRRCTPGRYERG
jgi:hypothetical protein